jgi:hypothetical protein
MASTFSVFRKNQRTLMAVFGVLLMIAFTLGGVLSEMGSATMNQNPVIATSRYGTIRGSDLPPLLEQRRIVQAGQHSKKNLLNSSSKAMRRGSSAPISSARSSSVWPATSKWR